MPPSSRIKKKRETRTCVGKAEGVRRGRGAHVVSAACTTHTGATHTTSPSPGPRPPPHSNTRDELTHLRRHGVGPPPSLPQDEDGGRAWAVASEEVEAAAPRALRATPPGRGWEARHTHPARRTRSVVVAAVGGVPVLGVGASGALPCGLGWKTGGVRGGGVGGGMCEAPFFENRRAGGGGPTPGRKTRGGRCPLHMQLHAQLGHGPGGGLGARETVRAASWWEACVRGGSEGATLAPAAGRVKGRGASSRFVRVKNRSTGPMKGRARRRQTSAHVS